MTSSPKEVVLTNIGNAGLSVSSITIAGANASDFAQTNTCASSLGPGAGCTISVTLTAAATGARSASVTIQDDAAGSPHRVTLAGSGVTILVTPPVATLTLGKPQQFTATGGGTSTYTWSVDGVSAARPRRHGLGRRAVHGAEHEGTHIVTATTPDGTQSGSATVYVVTSYPASSRSTTTTPAPAPTCSRRS